MLQVEARRLRGANVWGARRSARSRPATTTSSSSEAGPAGCRSRYFLARAGIERCAVISARRRAGRDVPALPGLPAPDQLDEAGRTRSRVARGSTSGTTTTASSATSRATRRLTPMFMDRTFDLPARREMEAALVEFAHAAAIDVRYGCEWLSTRIEDDGFVLGTSDGEYRCRACVFAIGVTEPWTAPIPGLEAAPHYADNPPDRYAGKSVFIVGKRNSGFEIAQGLLPWAPQLVLGLAASGRHRRARVLAASSPLPPAVRRARPRWIGEPRVDAAIERVERHGGYRIHAQGRPGMASSSSRRRGDRGDRLPCAAARPAEPRSSRRSTTAVCRRRRRTGRASRYPGSTSPGTSTQASPACASTVRRAARLGQRLSLQRPRPRPAHRGGLLGMQLQRPALHRDEVFRYLLARARSGAGALEAEGVSRSRTRLRRGGPRRGHALEAFVDEAGPGCRRRHGRARPGRRDPSGRVPPFGGNSFDRPLPPHPTNAFDSAEHAGSSSRSSVSCPFNLGPMCRSIHTLYNFEPPATHEEVHAAALQYVRKISGFTNPSQANAGAFDRAVDAVGGRVRAAAR